mmetsp:Transcript_10353/g.21895  ORF Transcript_10353/g.21895 Transcript_10353/m.21895 type:complete len:213 (-) Transcript_10353:371-1009(-)
MEASAHCSGGRVVDLLYRTEAFCDEHNEEEVAEDRIDTCVEEEGHSDTWDEAVAQLVVEVHRHPSYRQGQEDREEEDGLLEAGGFRPPCHHSFHLLSRGAHEEVEGHQEEAEGHREEVQEEAQEEDEKQCPLSCRQAAIGACSLRVQLEEKPSRHQQQVHQTVAALHPTRRRHAMEDVTQFLVPLGELPWSSLLFLQEFTQLHGGIVQFYVS